MEFETVEHDGRRVRFASLGSGTPVVLLHGFPDGPESFESIAQSLADAGHRAIVPFLRGYHPDTIAPGRAYGRAEFADDVVHLLDAVGEESAVIAGHDWGAAIAWAALSTYPERVRAVVPIAIPHPACLQPSPGLVWGVRHFFYFKLPWSDQRAARSDFAYIERLYRRWAPNWSGPSRDAALGGAKRRFADPAVLHEALQYYRDLSFKHDPSSRFRPACPGLIVMGGEDFGGDRAPYEASVEDAGHWPHLEGEAEFAERLLALVGSLDGE